MFRRIDKLGDLGTGIVSFSGGEPTLHPDLDALIRRVRRNGAIATIITNGYFLTPGRIEPLNAAGLDYLQISIDNVQPDEVSNKSLKVLDRKLEWLESMQTSRSRSIPFWGVRSKSGGRLKIAIVRGAWGSTALSAYYMTVRGNSGRFGTISGRCTTGSRSCPAGCLRSRISIVSAECDPGDPQ